MRESFRHGHGVNRSRNDDGGNFLLAVVRSATSYAVGQKSFRTRQIFRHTDWKNSLRGQCRYAQQNLRGSLREFANRNQNLSNGFRNDVAGHHADFADDNFFWRACRRGKPICCGGVFFSPSRMIEPLPKMPPSKFFVINRQFKRDDINARIQINSNASAGNNCLPHASEVSVHSLLQAGKAPPKFSNLEIRNYATTSAEMFGFVSTDVKKISDGVYRVRSFPFTAASRKN